MSRDYVQAVSVEHELGDGDDENIAVPDGHYIYCVVVEDGDTAPGSGITLTIRAPSHFGRVILSLNASRLASSSFQVFNVRDQAHNILGASISQSTIPIYLPYGGLDARVGGTVISGGTIKVKVFSSPFPPVE